MYLYSWNEKLIRFFPNGQTPIAIWIATSYLLQNTTLKGFKPQVLLSEEDENKEANLFGKSGCLICFL